MWISLTCTIDSTGSLSLSLSDRAEGLLLETVQEILSTCVRAAGIPRCRGRAHMHEQRLLLPMLLEILQHLFLDCERHRQF